jgi:maltose O-acetyltransferase
MKGRLFDNNSSENRARRDFVHEKCRAYTRSPSKGHFKKLKEIFKSCGNHVRIEYGFHCDYGNKIRIGNNTYFNINCSILDGGNVEIGDDVLIGPNVQIVTLNHSTNPIDRLKKTAYVKDISIGNNVWIGAGVILLPGTKIENGVVVAAGSVVKGLLKKDHLYAGIPAKRIKELN